MASLLLHSCCGPCTTYTVEYWRGQQLEVTAFWFNPNIHPFQEHQRRLEAMQALAQAVDLPLIVPPGYQMLHFLRRVVRKEGDRCLYCFRLRLSQTAAQARERGMDGFSTTLLISPYQKHELLRQIGEEVARKHGVAFLYHDLRSGYQRSRQLSKERNLYRQQYCGCLYSEWERFAKITIPSGPFPFEEG